jgi:hypothetical protein
LSFMFNSYRNLLDKNTYLRLFVSADTKYKKLRGGNVESRAYYAPL